MKLITVLTTADYHNAILEHHYEVMPEPLPVPITKGKRGKWVIDTFTLTAADVRRDNLRNYFSKEAELMCKPGTYTRLLDMKAIDKVVMSNTPMEVRTNRDFIRAATGRVLISGLGLGMALKAVLDKPEVEFVKVIEIDEDLIQLVGPGFKKEIDEGRLVIVNADAFAYKPELGEKYDVAWHDIWSTIDDGNLVEMGRLKRKWAKRIPLQLCWAQKLCQRMKRSSWGNSRVPGFLFG